MIIFLIFLEQLWVYRKQLRVLLDKLVSAQPLLVFSLVLFAFGLLVVTQAKHAIDHGRFGLGVSIFSGAKAVRCRRVSHSLHVLFLKLSVFYHGLHPELV